MKQPASPRAYPVSCTPSAEPGFILPHSLVKLFGSTRTLDFFSRGMCTVWGKAFGFRKWT